MNICTLLLTFNYLACFKHFSLVGILGENGSLGTQIWVFGANWALGYFWVSVLLTERVWASLIWVLGIAFGFGLNGLIKLLQCTKKYLLRLL